MASDAGSAGRMPGRRAVHTSFHWVASSPSPAETAALEARFPEVVHVSSSALEAETDDWHQRAVLMRTFNKWVPAEAFLREFRRGGIAGEILPLSLAHRCHIFRFVDREARDMILNRPWTVNGQPVAAEAWKPEFIPSAASISSALLWIRLPNLPIEFWREETLREIIEPAGQFVLSDSATMARSRGSFARVCARVDLRFPLRPGTRLRGLNGTFWQQFSFENMDGICQHCGSIHLNGVCLSPPPPASASEADGVRFGSWMSVIRQRREAQGDQSNGRGIQKKGSVTVSSAPGSSEPPLHPAPGTVAEGWSAPLKLARRRSARGQALAESKGGGQVNAASNWKKELTVAHKVLGPIKRAELKHDGSAASVFQQSENSDIQQTETASSHSLMTKNPFASLALEMGDVSTMGSRDVCPGPLKRARPVEYQAPRVISKKDIKKGKGDASFSKMKNKKCVVPDLSDSIPGSSFVCLAQNQVGVEAQTPRTSGLYTDLTDVISPSQGLGLMPSELPYRPVEAHAPMICCPQPHEEVTRPEGLPDSVMSEDQAGSLCPPST